jgi:hypothetical protein
MSGTRRFDAGQPRPEVVGCLGGNAVNFGRLEQERAGLAGEFPCGFDPACGGHPVHGADIEAESFGDLRGCQEVHCHEA